MRFTIYLYQNKKMPAFFREAMQEYEKRLTRYCKITLNIIKKEKEWKSKVESAKNAVLIVPGGKALQLSSVELSQTIGQEESHGVSGREIYIPSAEMLEYTSDKLSDKLALSSFIHEPPMAGMILLEQLYRAYRILNGHPYHK